MASKRSRNRSPPRREGFEGRIGKHQESLQKDSIPGIFHKPERNPSIPTHWIILQGRLNGVSFNSKDPESIADGTARFPGLAEDETNQNEQGSESEAFYRYIYGQLRSPNGSIQWFGIDSPGNVGSVLEHL
jgi:hypothetical protein